MGRCDAPGDACQKWQLAGVVPVTFGEGHSTLEVLAASTPEYIKIATRLARSSHVAGSRAAVAALVTFADTLGARVIAEGLETSEQVDAMGALGVGIGQGYFLGRPAATAALN